MSAPARPQTTAYRKRDDNKCHGAPQYMEDRIEQVEPIEPGESTPSYDDSHLEVVCKMVVPSLTCRLLGTQVQAAIGSEGARTTFLKQGLRYCHVTEPSCSP